MTSRRYWAGPLVGGLMLLLAGLPAEAFAQEVNLVAEGAAVYGDMCGLCHNARSPLERSNRGWVTIMNHMRVRANLTGPQARTVLAFLQASNEDPGTVRPITLAPPTAIMPDGLDAPASTDTMLIAQGLVLSTEKACVGCHVIGDVGANVGPDLNGVVQRRGLEYVRQKLANPAFDNESSMMPNFGLTEEQIEALVAYLNTLD